MVSTDNTHARTHTWAEIRGGGGGGDGGRVHHDLEGGDIIKMSPPPYDWVLKKSGAFFACSLACQRGWFLNLNLDEVRGYPPPHTHTQHTL